MATTPCHILLLNVFFAPFRYGGATVVAEAVARRLISDHGCRISAISVLSRPELAPYQVIRCETNGITNYLINLPQRRSDTERYDNPTITEITARLARDLDPDLVHAHCLQDLGAGVLGGLKEQGRKIILSLHDFWWICERQFMIRANGRYCGQDPVRLADCQGCVADMAAAETRQARLWDQAALADLVTCPSQFAHDLIARSGLPMSRSAVWTNGITGPGPDFFAKQAARRGRDPRRAFGYLGGPGPVKGWPLIRDAFARIQRSDFSGYLVDASIEGDWWYGTRLSRLKGDWQVLPRFDQESMDDFYARIDVLLFPSQWKETFGLTIREALSRGIAVIQTDSGGTTEWPGANPETMLQIGAGADALLARIQAALDAPSPGITPVDMPGYDAQAQAFVDLAATL